MSWLKPLKNLFSIELPAAVLHVTRAQARRLILSALGPTLKQAGFEHKKGNNLWRVGDFRSDVIQLRFLRAEERGDTAWSESEFTLLYGSYYHFIPTEFGEEHIRKLDNLITPEEYFCHLRWDLRYQDEVRKVIQKCVYKDRGFWHLNCSLEEQQAVLNDVKRVLEQIILPTLENYSSAEAFLEHLNDPKKSLGMPSKNYLRAFTLLYLGKLQDALVAFEAAARDADQIFERNKKLFDSNPEAPVFKFCLIIKETLNELKSRIHNQAPIAH